VAMQLCLNCFHHYQYNSTLRGFVILTLVRSGRRMPQNDVCFVVILVLCCSCGPLLVRLARCLVHLRKVKDEVMWQDSENNFIIFGVIEK